jgi:hypothetical protein
MTMSAARTSPAAPLSEFVDPHPTAGNRFGYVVQPLSTGNVVVTAPLDDAGGADAGAVYLFNGSTGALISTLLGSTAGDNIGYGVTALTNGNYVVRSQYWHNGAAANAGAATWCSGTTGLAGVVSAANSLVGTTANDNVGGNVVALTNGNYVVACYTWSNGGNAYAGAVTWGSGTAGVTGVVSAANSLVGTAANSYVGDGGAIPLSNGNYVVSSYYWPNGSNLVAGAATWGNGTTGVVGTISAANSLVGTSTSDQVSSGGIIALTNGNYVLRSPLWSNGSVAGAGAATWGNGTTGSVGVVSAANSLVGTSTTDQVSAGGITKLSNGNYVVSSQLWDNGSVTNAGAATWGNGSTGIVGVITAANSLVGVTAGSAVGGRVTALTNGNYVVGSSNWDPSGAPNAGAATLGSGIAGVSGTISSANSLVGTVAGDQVGYSVTALSNGNYVVSSQFWHNGASASAGAATWGSGTVGVTGTVSSANSLVGSTASDNVGYYLTPLTNGNYVVSSFYWHNGAVAGAGAVTWGNGSAGTSGVVSPANSIVGSTANDQVGSYVRALTGGAFVVGSTGWDNGAVVDAGAATWGSGTGPLAGTISAGNSLVGSTAGDYVGSQVTALTNGNYVVSSSAWSNGATAAVGAATWGSGATGVTGTISSANSLVGSTANDYVGNAGVTALGNGNYVVSSPQWHYGALANAGAVTWGSGTNGKIGVVSTGNSLIGRAANTNLQPIAVDNVNATFLCRFLLEDGGRVRVGPVPLLGILSALDIPGDQGGWLRVTFTPLALDMAGASPAASSYGVWRHVPGTLPAGATGASTPDAVGIAHARAGLPAGVDVSEVAGRLYVIGSGTASTTSAFPAGTWELVASVPALQLLQYVVAVPTTSNAAPNEYLLTAQTTIPTEWYISDPMSGQSVDNLAPAQPTLISAAYSGGQTHLAWSPNAESDLGGYRLYRGASAAFTPDPSNRIALQIATGYADPGAAGRYYKLSAVDVNGNESGFTLVTPAATTGVDGIPSVAFALEGARPNPASGAGLDVAFALPTGAAARIELVDLSGRRVLTREVGSMGAGAHTVNLSEGHRVSPGLYWVRLTQGTDRRTTRVAVID